MDTSFDWFAWVLVVLAVLALVTATVGERMPSYWGALSGSVLVRKLSFASGVTLVAFVVLRATPIL